MSKTEINIAETIAICAHFGQVDKDGSMYLNHPAAVMASVADKFKAVAWLHDVLEDCAWCSPGMLLAAGIERDTLLAVQILTREDWQEYGEYIGSIAESENLAAITVKIADLTHNLRPGCPERLIPRYQKALARLKPILEKLELGVDDRSSPHTKTE